MVELGEQRDQERSAKRTIANASERLKACPVFSPSATDSKVDSKTPDMRHCYITPHEHFPQELSTRRYWKYLSGRAIFIHSIETMDFVGA